MYIRYLPWLVGRDGTVRHTTNQSTKNNNKLPEINNNARGEVNWRNVDERKDEADELHRVGGAGTCTSPTRRGSKKKIIANVEPIDLFSDTSLAMCVNEAEVLSPIMAGCVCFPVRNKSSVFGCCLLVFPEIVPANQKTKPQHNSTYSVCASRCSCFPWSRCSLRASSPPSTLNTDAATTIPAVRVTRCTTATGAPAERTAPLPATTAAVPPRVAVSIPAAPATPLRIAGGATVAAWTFLPPAAP